MRWEAAYVLAVDFGLYLTVDLLLDQDRREKQLRAENCQYNRLTIERCYRHNSSDRGLSCRFSELGKAKFKCLWLFRPYADQVGLRLNCQPPSARQR